MGFFFFSTKLSLIRQDVLFPPSSEFSPRLDVAYIATIDLLSFYPRAYLDFLLWKKNTTNYNTNMYILKLLFMCSLPKIENGVDGIHMPV